jgi:hypothetical protein
MDGIEVSSVVSNPPIFRRLRSPVGVGTVRPDVRARITVTSVWLGAPALTRASRV